LKHAIVQSQGSFILAYPPPLTLNRLLLSSNSTSASNMNQKLAPNDRSVPKYAESITKKYFHYPCLHSELNPLRTNS
jgi:hypothetical protein